MSTDSYHSIGKFRGSAELDPKFYVPQSLGTVRPAHRLHLTYACAATATDSRPYPSGANSEPPKRLEPGCHHRYRSQVQRLPLSYMGGQLQNKQFLKNKQFCQISLEYSRKKVQSTRGIERGAGGHSPPLFNYFFLKIFQFCLKTKLMIANNAQAKRRSNLHEFFCKGTGFPSITKVLRPSSRFKTPLSSCKVQSKLLRIPISL